MQNGHLRTSSCSRVVIQPVLVPVPPQHRHRRTYPHQVQPQSDVTIRLHETVARKTQQPKTKRNRGMTVEIRTTRLRDLPECLEVFTVNPEDTEVLAPAHSSQDSGSERPPKVVSKSRKRSIYTHFPKDRNCEVCLREQDDKGSLQKTNWRSSTSSSKVW